MVKWLENRGIVYRLRATNVKDRDIWAAIELRQYIEHWSKNAFPHGAPEVISYIPTAELIKALEDDIRKLQAIKELDNPDNYGEGEIGSPIHTTGEYGDSGEAGIDTLIDYIKNLIKQLTKCAEY